MIGYRFIHYICRLLGLARPRTGCSRKNFGGGINDRDRFDKFTERARKVLSLAQEEAQRLQHNYIGTEHLLLGLVREGEGIAAGVLESLGVNLEKVRTQTIQVLHEQSE
jgi:ClpA/ClpB-like protein